MVKKNDEVTTLQLVDPSGRALTLGEPPAQTATALRANVAVEMFERLAKDESVNVDKLERLIAMQERVMAVQAKADFMADFSRLQAELPPVVKNRRIAGKTKDGGDFASGSYATFDTIQNMLKTILPKFGFMLTFGTSWDKGNVTVTGKLGHIGGHVETADFMSGGDASGGKNPIQALGSAQSYGMRYTTKALLNIIEVGVDDDGKSAPGVKTEPKPREQKPAAAAPVDRPKNARELVDDLAADYNKVITVKQRERFWAVAGTLQPKPTKASVGKWLETMGVKDGSSSNITRGNYDDIVAALQTHPPGLR